MRAATSEQLIQAQALGLAPQWRSRPRLWFEHPDDVVEERSLSPAEKRAVLSSWASDASAVRDEPALRWLLGTPEPVSLDDIRAALAALDEQDAC